MIFNFADGFSLWFFFICVISGKKIKQTWAINQKYQLSAKIFFQKTTQHYSEWLELQRLKEEMTQQEVYQIRTKIDHLKKRVKYQRNIFTGSRKVLISREDLAYLYELFSLEAMLQAENKAYIAYLEISYLE